MKEKTRLAGGDGGGLAAPELRRGRILRARVHSCENKSIGLLLAPVRGIVGAW